MGKEVLKVGFKIGFNKRPTRRNSRIRPVLAKFRMNNIHPDLKFRNQQVSGSSPEGGSIKIKELMRDYYRDGWYSRWYS